MRRAGLALEHASSAAICLPMISTLSHSPGAAWRASRAARARCRGTDPVAPDEVDLEQLQLQVAARRLAVDRDLHQVGGLVVQAVRHVEVGFGQRVLLIEAHLRLAADRLVGSRARRERGGSDGLEARSRRLARRAVGAGSSSPPSASSSESSTTNESRSRALVTGDIAGAARVERGSKSRPGIESTDRQRLPRGAGG